MRSKLTLGSEATKLRVAVVRPLLSSIGRCAAPLQMGRSLLTTLQAPKSDLGVRGKLVLRATAKAPETPPEAESM